MVPKECIEVMASDTNRVDLNRAVARVQGNPQSSEEPVGASPVSFQQVTAMLKIPCADEASRSRRVVVNLGRVASSLISDGPGLDVAARESQHRASPRSRVAGKHEIGG